jgi:hypothetical protein
MRGYSKGKVYVVGPESSGQKWFRRMLRSHKELTNLIAGDSFPSGEGDKRHYPDPKLHVGDVCIVMCRDCTISQASVHRRGYNGRTRGQFSEVENIEALMKFVRQFNQHEVLFVSYEGLIRFGRPYFDYILGWLGVSKDAQFYPEDQNKKYIKQ